MLVLLAVAAWYGWGWLKRHPEANPLAPLSLAHPIGWTTHDKIVALADDVPACRGLLAAHGVAFTVLSPTGADACRAEDRTAIGPDAARGWTLRPAGAATTCPVAAAYVLWLERGVQPAARTYLDSPVVAVEHLGTRNCRRIAGSASWSEHASGNAIDVAAFVLADGRRVSVRHDWTRGGAEAAFLHRARDVACDLFGTTLSPDYNAAHADHLHLDQADRVQGTMCR